MKLPCLVLIAGLVAAAGAQAQTPAPAPPSREAALKTVMEACKSVTPQLCPGLRGDTALACLETNIEKLTPGCKDAVLKLAKLNL
jgi:hypothetical protein